MSETLTSTDAAILERFEADGWAVVPAVLTPAETAAARDALVRAAAESEAAGMPTTIEDLDPGGRNVRIYDLIEHDPVFLDLATHPRVLALVQELLDHDLAISNMTANIALPGSGSMNAHNDQSTIAPEPWPVRWCMNAIWCLDDVDEGNGATRFLPGSHRSTGFADIPPDARDRMAPFVASAGSVILMDGRLWHTSGANTSTDRERAMAFVFYARSFLRHQNNWGRSLSRDTKATLSPQVKEWLGLGFGNMAYGTYLAGRSHGDVRG